MHRRSLRAAWYAILGALWLSGLGCGAAPPAPGAEPSASETTGEENAAPIVPASSEEAPAAPEAAPQGPGTVTVEASVRGKPVSCEVQLLASDGSEVARGQTGQPITAQSGEYLMAVHLADKAVLFDTPTDRRPLTLQAGDQLHEKVEFRWSMIQLNVRVNGTAENNATVVLRRQGAVIGELKSGAEHVPVSPGRYDAQVKTRGAVIEVEGLMFPEGGSQSVPVNVRM